MVDVHISVFVTIVRHIVLQCDMEVLQQTPWSSFSVSPSLLETLS